MSNLDSDYWNNRYLESSTPWDLGQISPPLKEYIDQIENKELRILIPGAGSAYEAFYLEHLGFKSITVLDISSYSIDQIKLKSKKINAINEDFFSHQGVYDIIIEQTFFCAIEPKLRTKLINKINDILAVNGKYLGLLFNRQFDSNGPPFSGSIDEYRLLFENIFQIRTLEPCKNSYPGREEVFFIFEK
jgi:methyl halide transferase